MERAWKTIPGALVVWAALCSAAPDVAAQAPDPTSPSGLVLWLDAADRGSFFQDAARSTSLAKGGGPVGAWADKSGAGNHVVQPTPEFRPSLAPDARNGKSALVFDGIDDWLDAESFAPYLGPANWTSFLVVQPSLSSTPELPEPPPRRPRAAARGAEKDKAEEPRKPRKRKKPRVARDGAAVVLMATGGDSLRRGFQVPPPGYLVYKNKSKGRKGDVESPFHPDDSWQIWEFVNDGSSVAILVNGDEKVSAPAEGRGTFPLAAVGAKRETPSKKARKRKGARADAKEFWYGSMGEILFFADARNAAQRREIRENLARKWDIVLAPSAGAPPGGGGDE